MEKDLAKIFVQTVANLEEGSTFTWDDFFDANNVHRQCRSNFAIAAIYKQAIEKYGYTVGKKQRALDAKLQDMFNIDFGMDFRGTAFVWVSLWGIDKKTRYGSFRRITQESLEGRMYRVEDSDGGIAVLILDSVFNPRFIGEKGWSNPLKGK